jgi:hypothetical protein
MTKSPVPRNSFTGGVTDRSARQSAYRPEDDAAGNRSNGRVASPVTRIRARRNEDDSSDQ